MLYGFCNFFKWKRIMKKVGIKKALKINNEVNCRFYSLNHFYAGNHVKMCFSDDNSVFVFYLQTQSFLTIHKLFYCFWVDSYFWIDFSQYSYYASPQFPEHYLFKNLYCPSHRPFLLSCCPIFLVFDFVYKISRTFFVLYCKSIIIIYRCRSIDKLVLILSLCY